MVIEVMNAMPCTPSTEGYEAMQHEAFALFYKIDAKCEARGPCALMLTYHICKRIT